MWFPRLASDQAVRVQPSEGPFAIIHRSGNTDHLHCLNRVAEAEGLRRGMGLADARALCRDLVTRPADLAREMAMLRALRRWAGRYSPSVGRDVPDGLVADITGVAHLYGGEEGVRADLHARLGRAGFEVASAIADTRGAAFALARSPYGGNAIRSDAIARPGQTADAVRMLPLSLLRIDHNTVEGLGRLGLRLVGDIADLPRAPLARRFGPELLLRLDQTLGAQPEPVAAESELQHYGVRMTLPEPIGLASDVMAGLDRLLDRLCAVFVHQATGARRLSLELRRVDKAAVMVEIGLARPMRDPARMAALFARKIAEVDAGYGIDAMRLTAPVVEPLAPAQIDTSLRCTDDDLVDLITRLGNRLGFDNVQKLLPAESLVPERSFLVVPAAYMPEVVSANWTSRLPRPLVIFPSEPISASGSEPPQRFRWRRIALTTLRARGPERITPEWWLDDPAWRAGLRDYWKVETRQGQRLWMFHTPQNPGWYVQGEFA